ncbi:FecR family protein [Chitinophaga lutea]
MQSPTDRFLWLLSRRLSGDITDEESRELEALLREHPEYKQASSALGAYWRYDRQRQDAEDTQAAFERLTDRIRKEDVFEWKETAPRPTARRRWLKIAAAAAILLAAGLFLQRLQQDGMRSDYNVKGTRSQIKLADGTSVWLNSDSELKYPARFKGSTREVFLKGEAFFDVAKDAARPFIVHTETMHLNVLGTSFNVKAYPGDSTAEATLISGEVEVEVLHQPGRKVRLKPDEKLVLPKRLDTLNGAIATETPVILKPTYYLREDSAIIETAWVDNRLLFQDESFTHLAARMERWYNVSVRFENAAIQQLRFTGVFGKETLEQALQALQLTENFRYRISDDTVVIY